MIDNTIHDAGTEKPGLWETVRAWKANGTSEPAMWTGNRWWTYNGTILVERWQLLPKIEPGSRSGPWGLTEVLNSMRHRDRTDKGEPPGSRGAK